MIKFENIKAISKKYPDKIAVMDDVGSISWAQFYEYTHKLIHVVNSDQYLSSAEVVLFISKNSTKIVLLSAAFSSLGIPFQGLDYHLDENVIIKIIKQLDCKAIFMEEEFENKFSALHEICDIYLISNFIASHFEKLKDDNNVEKPLQLMDKPFRSYAFTSGTSGIPKIVYRNQSFDKRRFDYLIKSYDFNSEDVHLTCLPFYHVSSSGWARLFLSLGCTLVVHQFKNNYQLCELLHTHKISTAILSPIMLKEITDILDDDSDHYFKKLRFLITGGKNCTNEIKQRAIKKLGRIIYEYYGTTETGINTLLNSDEALLYPGSVGRTFEGNDIQIFDESNSPLGVGKAGKVAISSYMNMQDYLNYASHFVEMAGKHYFVTSDYGYKDDAGYVYIMQRSNAQQKHIYDYHLIENQILQLGYLMDVHISCLENDECLIKVVPKKYYPLEKIREHISSVLKTFDVNHFVLKIESKLDYTLTGKIKLLSTTAA